MYNIKNFKSRLKTASILFLLFFICLKNIYIYKILIKIVFLIIIFEYSSNLIKSDNLSLIRFSLIGILWLVPFFYLILTNSRNNILKILVVNAISDIFQYIFGNIFGKFIKYKPFPLISPNKTLIGYFLGLTISFFIASLIFNFKYYELLLILLFGIMGDLFASYIKRKLKIKDFSNILSKHGGVLDRLDSLIFSLTLFSLFKFLKKGLILHK